MVNGNDIIEFEENNIENLDTEFCKKKGIELSDLDYYKEKKADEWNEFVMDEFNNARVS